MPRQGKARHLLVSCGVRTGICHGTSPCTAFKFNTHTHNCPQLAQQDAQPQAVFPCTFTSSSTFTKPHIHVLTRTTNDDPPRVFVIYTPTGSPQIIGSNFSLKEARALHDAAPGGGTILSTHHPDNALSWVESHHGDLLLSAVRSRGIGGPIPTMLVPEVQALAIFGSIHDKWVLKAAKLLADASGFPVMIRHRANDPLLVWREPSGPVSSSDGANNVEEDRVAPADGVGADWIKGPSWMSPVHTTDVFRHLPLRR
ncbi:hypothetical protein DFH09DRAFT_1304297 [Mycena vulgaris]|nr:hypothetical protein DFH09DRAFT_1304297 [Mycena vulgaris]